MLTIIGTITNQITGKPYQTSVLARLTVKLCQKLPGSNPREVREQCPYTSNVDQRTGRFTFRIPDAALQAEQAFLKILYLGQEIRRFDKEYIKVGTAPSVFPILLPNAVATLRIALRDENEESEVDNQQIVIQGLVDGSIQDLLEGKTNENGQLVYRLNKTRIEEVFHFSRPVLQVTWLKGSTTVARRDNFLFSNLTESIRLRKKATTSPEEEEVAAGGFVHNMWTKLPEKDLKVELHLQYANGTPKKTTESFTNSSGLFAFSIPASVMPPVEQLDRTKYFLKVYKGTNLLRQTIPSVLSVNPTIAIPEINLEVLLPNQEIPVSGTLEVNNFDRELLPSLTIEALIEKTSSPIVIGVFGVNEEFQFNEKLKAEDLIAHFIYGMPKAKFRVKLNDLVLTISKVYTLSDLKQPLSFKISLPDYQYEVKGKVVDYQQKPQSGLVIRAFNRLLGRETLLGETKTASDGNYSLNYDPSLLEEQDKPNLIVRVIDAGTAEIIFNSPLFLNAQKAAVVNIALGVDEEHPFLAKSEFQLMEELLGQWKRKANPKNINRQDIRYISSKTKMDPRRVGYYFQAHKLAEESEIKEQQIKIDAEIYYGLLRKGMPVSKDALLLHPTSSTKSAIDAAIKGRVINPVKAEAINNFFKDKRDLILAEKIQYEEGKEPSIIQILNTAGVETSPEKKDRHKEFLGVYLDRRESLHTLWEGLHEKDNSFYSDQKIKDIQFALQVNHFTRNNPKLTDLLIRGKGEPRPGGEINQGIRSFKKGNERQVNITSIRDITFISKQNLINMIDEVGVPEQYEGGENKEKYREVLEKSMEQLYPTIYLAREIQASTPEDNFVKFVESNPSFDFYTHHVSTFQKENPNAFDFIEDEGKKEVFKKELSGRRAVYMMLPRKLNNKSKLFNLLREKSLTSPAKIARMGKQAFLEKFTVDDQEAARKIFYQAKQIHTASLIAMSKYHGQLSNVHIPAIRGARKVVKDQIASDEKYRYEATDLPDLERLFYPLDYPDCKECQSVLSPSAYLVDQLAYLDTIPAPTGVKTAKDHLLELRPDLNHVQLTCKNSDTALPYIDLVNEILESVVARDHGEDLPDDENKVGQTQLTTTELKAMPQYLNNDAYDKLYKKDGQPVCYPWNLPFNLNWEETRILLDFIKQPRYQLMEIWDKENDYVSLEYLGITKAEKDLITDNSEEKVAACYNGIAAALTDGGPDEKGSVQKLLHHLKFSTKEQESYDIFRSLIRTFFINPPNALGLREKIYYKPSDGKVEYNLKNTWFNFSATFLRDLHRFWRLKQKTNWSDVELDKVIRHLNWETAEPRNLDKIVKHLYYLKRLETELKQPLLTVLSWGTPFLDTAGVIDQNEANNTLVYGDYWYEELDSTEKIPSLYENLFLSQAVNNPVLYELFALDPQGRELKNKEQCFFIIPEEKEDVSNKVLNPKYISFILGGVNMKAEELLLLIEQEELLTPENNPKITLNRLSHLYRISSFCKALKINVRDYLYLRKLYGKSFLGVSPEEVFKFVSLFNRIKSTGFSPEALGYLLLHQYTAKSTLSPKQKETGIFFTALRNTLNQHVAANTLSEQKNEGILQFYLSWLKGYSGNQVEEIMDLLSLQSGLKISEQTARMHQYFGEVLRNRYAGAFKSIFGGTEPEIPIETDVPSLWVKLTDKISDLEDIKDKEKEQLLAIVQGVSALEKEKQITLIQGLLKNEDWKDTDSFLIFTYTQRIDFVINRLMENCSLPGFASHNSLVALYDQIIAVIGDGAFLIRKLIEKIFELLDGNYAENEDKQKSFIKLHFHALDIDEVSEIQEKLAKSIEGNEDKKDEEIKKRYGFLLGKLKVEIEELDLQQLKKQMRQTLRQHLKKNYWLNHLASYLLHIIAPLKEEALEKEEKMLLTEDFLGSIINPEKLLSVFIENESTTGNVPNRIDEALRFITLGHEIARQFGIHFGIDWHLISFLLNSGLNVTESDDRKAIDPFWDSKNFLGFEDEICEEEYGEQFQTYEKLYKAIFILKKLNIEPEDIELIFKGAKNDDWLNFNTLPITEKTNMPSDIFLIKLVHLAELSSIQQKHFPGDYSVFQVLDLSEDKFVEKLGEITEWGADEIRFLHEKLSSDSITKTVLFTKIIKAFETRQQIGLPIQHIWKWIQSELNKNVTKSVRNALKAKYGLKKWLEIAPPLRNRLREKQRDALVAYLTAYRSFNDPFDLYDQYLIDPEMQSCMMTSRTKQAISSVQLYVQKLHQGLIKIDAQQFLIPTEKREEWKWRKNYRVWEANRKVFLYPENWIEPELRLNKTPFFKELEDELLQDEINEQNVESAYLRYLEKLDAVARLEIAAHYLEEDKDILHVFARTYGKPHKYYYRRWIQKSYWTPWEKVELDIQGEHLIPFVQKNRLKLIWVEFVEKQKKETPTAEETIWKHVSFWESEYKHRKWLPKVKLGDFKLPWYHEEIEKTVFFATEINNDSEKQSGSLTLKLRKAPDEQFISSIAISHDDTPILQEKRYELSFQNGLEDKDELSTSYGADCSLYEKCVLREDLNHSFQKIISKSQDNLLTLPKFVNKVELPGLESITFSFEGVLSSNREQTIKILYPSQQDIFSNDRLQLPFFYEDNQNTFLVLPSIKFIYNSVEIGIVELPGLVNGRIPPESIADALAGINTGLGDIPYDDKDDLGFSESGNGGLPDLAGTAPPLHNIEGIAAINQSPVAINNTWGNETLQGEIYHTDQTGQGIINEAYPAITETLAQLHAENPVFEDPGLSGALGGQHFGFERKSNTGSRSDGKISFTQEKNPVPVSASAEFEFINFYHPYTDLFYNRLNTDGIDGLLAPDNRAETGTDIEYKQLKFQQVQQAVFGEGKDYQPIGTAVKNTDLVKEIDFEWGGSYSTYNWELFFHIPLLIADRLSRDQKFEEAQKWFHYIFNPTNPEGDIDNRYWQIKPFRNANGANIRDLLEIFSDKNLDQKKKLIQQIKRWQTDPFQPHLIAEFRIVAYMWTVVMKYIDNLIAWGDQLFRRFTIETINEASQLYILAAQLLGKKPIKVSVSTQRDDSLDTANEILTKLTADFNQLIEELSNIDDGEEWYKVITGLDNEAGTRILDTIFTPYFCIPQNKKLSSYWTTVSDRLFKIRHCMDIGGKLRQMPLFEPPIDPAMLVRAVAAGVDISSAISNMSAPLPHYRFNFMLQKALEICNDVKALGGQLLSALEKRDAEKLSLIRATQEKKLLKGVKEIKLQSIKEAEHSYAGLVKSQEIVSKRYEHYRDIEKISSNEKIQQDRLMTARVWQSVEQGLNLIANLMHLTPDTYAGCPCPGTTFGGSNLGNAVKAYAGYFSTLSSIEHYYANKAAIKASHDRRWDEWKLLERTTEIEIEQIEQQKLAAEIRKQIAEKDFQNHELQIENAEEIESFLKEKFTNNQLYNWMTGQISRLYFQSYQLAYDIAKQAEKAFRHELGDNNTSFIEFGYWDSLKKGLLSGEKLHYGLRRMETAYLAQNKREHELTKHISLALLNPKALLLFRETGSCYFDIPELAFDLDQAGHYFRRIKSVSISIPCVVGPYTNLGAKLTLITSRIRKNSDTEDGYGMVKSEMLNDSRFTYNFMGGQSIATSHANNDSGLFELNFRDERYLPFEGAGAISSWRLELPTEFRQFDYNTISDVVLHMNYTARDGADAFKDIVKTSIEEGINNWVQATEGTGLLRLFSLKDEFPKEWNDLTHKPNDDCELVLTHRHFPFFVRERELKPHAVSLYFEPASGASLDVLPKGQLNDTLFSDVQETSLGAMKGLIFEGIAGSILPFDKESSLKLGLTVNEIESMRIVNIYMLMHYKV